MRGCVALAVALGAIGVAGCSSDEGSSGPTTSSSAQTVGPEGGTVEASGVTLTFPPGALAEDTEIEVVVGGTLDGAESISALYQLKPDGLRLAEPVDLVIDITPPADSERPAILWTPDEMDNWTILGGELVDGGTKLKASITHFSRYIGAELRPISDCMFWDQQTDSDLFDLCGLNGVIAGGDIRWTITEWGSPGDPQPNTDVALINLTNDHIKIMKVEVVDLGHVNPIHVGTPTSVFYDRVDLGWLRELNHGSSAWESSIQAIKANPDAADWTAGEWTYWPDKIGVFSDQSGQLMAWQMCIEWIRFDAGGIVDTGSDCIEYQGVPRPCPGDEIPDPNDPTKCVLPNCPPGQVPDPQDPTECIDFVAEDCANGEDDDGDGKVDCDDSFCADLSVCDKCARFENWVPTLPAPITVSDPYQVQEAVKQPGGSGCKCKLGSSTDACDFPIISDGELTHTITTELVEEGAGADKKTYIVYTTTTTGSFEYSTADNPNDECALATETFTQQIRKACRVLEFDYKYQKLRVKEPDGQNPCGVSSGGGYEKSTANTRRTDMWMTLTPSVSPKGCLLTDGCKHMTGSQGAQVDVKWDYSCTQ